MAQDFSHELLSGSTNGLGIVVAATSTPGTAVHTAVAGTTSRHEVYLWAYNGDADGETRTLTIEFGGTAAGNLIKQPIPAGAGLVPVLVGQPLRNALVVGAFADEANDVVLYGHTNVMTVT